MVMEANPCTQNYKKLQEVYQATGSEEVQLKTILTASDD
jgi:hypothetical protein